MGKRNVGWITLFFSRIIVADEEAARRSGRPFATHAQRKAHSFHWLVGLTGIEPAGSASSAWQVRHHLHSRYDQSPRLPRSLRRSDSAECQVDRLVETEPPAKVVCTPELALAEDIAKPCQVLFPQSLLQRGADLGPMGMTSARSASRTPKAPVNCAARR
jgi:hypothetical protein